MRRRLDRSLIDSLKRSDLWNNKLKNDCFKGEVMLAVRDNRIDFYYKGGKLFGYDKNGFKTHIKYAAVIDDDKNNYLTEDQLKAQKLIADFEARYERIKENCKNYSGIEAEGVSYVCASGTYMSDNDVIVLDVEVSFDATEDDRKQDRIDLLLFDKAKQSLTFAEAKHFSNTEIWSTTTPKVVGQVKRYEAQIEKERKNIIEQYGKNVEAINELFSLNLPKPISVNDNVGLLIFGFDSDQRSGRLKKFIHDNPAFKGVKLYCIGNVKGINPINLFK